MENKETYMYCRLYASQVQNNIWPVCPSSTFNFYKFDLRDNP